MSEAVARRHDARIYALACILGICAGIIDVRLGDLLLTAIAVMISTMVLGGLRPRKPWRWTLIVAIWVPTMQALAYYLLTERQYPSHIYEACLGFVTGTVGAFVGAFARLAINELFFAPPAPLPEGKPKVSAS